MQTDVWYSQYRNPDAHASRWVGYWRYISRYRLVIDTSAKSIHWIATSKVIMYTHTTTCILNVLLKHLIFTSNSFRCFSWRGFCSLLHFSCITASYWAHLYKITIHYNSLIVYNRLTLLIVRRVKCWTSYWYFYW